MTSIFLNDRKLHITKIFHFYAYFQRKQLFWDYICIYLVFLYKCNFFKGIIGYFNGTCKVVGTQYQVLFALNDRYLIEFVILEIVCVFSNWQIEVPYIYLFFLFHWLCCQNILLQFILKCQKCIITKRNQSKVHLKCFMFTVSSLKIGDLSRGHQHCTRLVWQSYNTQITHFS